MTMLDKLNAKMPALILAQEYIAATAGCPTPALRVAAREAYARLLAACGGEHREASKFLIRAAVAAESGGRYVLVDGVARPINTASERAEARAILDAANLAGVPVYVGRPDGRHNCIKTEETF